MPYDAVDKWLASGRSAKIGSQRLRPIEHAFAKGKPLSSQKGQAEAFFLTDDDGSEWILKKFRRACALDPSYLMEVSSVLPREKGFICGTDRLVLAASDLHKARHCHYSRDLDRWLEGTVLMPRIHGVDWACLADRIRAGEVVLEPEKRLDLCRNLTRLVELLEFRRCSHRDLSCGNVFIDAGTYEVSLIDFDSLFHPSLTMPNATTCGTEGYTAPYAWVNDDLDPCRSWCEGADRYALTLLNVEMLLLNGTMAATGEGGIFDQEELKNRSGRKIDAIVTELMCQYPGAEGLLLQAVRSQNAADCPCPRSWSSLLGRLSTGSSWIPALDEVPDMTDQIADFLARSRPTSPRWSVPGLSGLPVAVPGPPARRVSEACNVELPADAWSVEAGSSVLP